MSEVKATENKAKDVETPNKRKELLYQFAELQLQREAYVRQVELIQQQMANVRNQLAQIKGI